MDKCIVFLRWFFFGSFYMIFFFIVFWLEFGYIVIFRGNRMWEIYYLLFR